MKVTLVLFGVLLIDLRGRRQAIQLTPEEECHLLRETNRITTRGGGASDVSWLL